MRGRRYGAHRPEDVPTSVTVLEFRRWPIEVQAPYPAALAAQRQQINALAARGGDAPA